MNLANYGERLVGLVFVKAATNWREPPFASGFWGACNQRSVRRYILEKQDYCARMRALFVYDGVLQLGDIHVFRDTAFSQSKTQLADKGISLVKSCNAAMAESRVSRRAS